MQISNQFSTKKIFSKEYLFLFIVALFIRLPFFFRDYIDHDESTFILIGNTVAEGYLPYDYLWDLKPPLLFYIFGLVEYVFPHSLIAIRLFGVIVIFLTAIFLLQLTKTLRVKNGFIIALSYIILSSLFGAMQGVMSEHITLIFFIPGLLFFLKDKSPGVFFISGLLFGCALLCKLNMAYPLMAIVLYYFFFFNPEKGAWTKFKNCVLTGIGTIVPTIAIAVPYVLQHKLKLFIDSVFLATLEYGHNSNYSVAFKLSLTWWIIIAGILISFFAIKSAPKETRKIAVMLAAIILPTIFTFYSSVNMNGHYMILLYPFLSILIFGFIIKKEINPGYFKLAVLVLLLSIESHLEYIKLVKQFTKKSTFYNGNAFRAIEELKKRNLENSKIFFVNFHIGYWFLHKYPLTKSTTHPSSLIRPNFFKHFGDNRNSMQEVIYLMEEVYPEVIVSRTRMLTFFSETNPENIYFIERLKNYYEIVYENPDEKLFIWKKKNL